MRRSFTILAGAVALAAGLPAGAQADRFHARVTNPWFPLQPGMRWTYRGVDSGRPSRDVIRVAHRTAVIGGMRCAVVLDRVYIDGHLAERTTDWYTQDSRGRVRYAGEATAELDRRGRVKNTDGSWRSGRHGAHAGIYMPAVPRVGQAFSQEHARGVAQDRFSVTSVDARAATPFAIFPRHVLQTRETTPLEPGVVDGKRYVRGIGEVSEFSIRGGNDRLRLVTFRAG
jgi:hypothetical protein